MKLVLGNKKIDFDELFLGFLILNLLLLVFINKGQRSTELLITFVSIIRIVQWIPWSKAIRNKILLIGGVFIYLFGVTVINGHYDYVGDNVRFLIRPILLFVYLTCLIHKKPQLINKVIFQNYRFFNIYYFVNFFIMLAQIKKGVFYDNITGFLGMYGTHRLTAFVCFLVLLNMQVIEKAKRRRKIYMLIYMVFILTSTLWISSVNDNTAMYVMLPVVIIFYQFCTNKISFSMFIKITLMIIITYILFEQLIKVDEIRQFFDKRLFAKLGEMSLIFSEGKMEEERYVYIEYALEYLNGRRYGVGLGQVKMIGDKRLSSIDVSLRNWGMSNVSSLITIGGVVFMFIYVVIYGYIVSAPSKNIKRFVTVCIIFLMFFYYGQVITSIPMITAVWMMLCPFFCQYKPKASNKIYNGGE